MTGCTLVGSLGWEPLLQSISVWSFLQPPHLFQFPKSWEFFHLISPDAVPMFPFPSFLSLLNWHLTFSCLPLNTTADTPSGMNYWNFAGKISLSFLLATSNVLLFFFFIFVLFEFHAMFTSSTGCCFDDQDKEFGSHQAISEPWQTDDYSQDGNNMTGSVL